MDKPRRYRAFISYSHAADGRLAPALEQALKLFARPWLRLRAFNVFRDEASLSANPALWPAIERALDDSDFFILLASPDAALSDWVAKEVGHWLSRRPADKILIALTDGDIAWNESAQDFDWPRSTAVPPMLRGAFGFEPRWIDLRFASRESDVSLNNPSFRAAVADIAATLHSRPKDELIGEDVALLKKSRRVRRLFITGLAILTTAAIAIAAAAWQQRNQALRQDSLRLAERSRDEARNGNYGTAVRLALQALPETLGLGGVLQRPYVAEAEVALLRALHSNRERVRLVGHRGEVSDIDLSADSTRVATAASDGFVRIWDTRTGMELHRFAPSDVEALSAVFSPDATQLVVGGLGGAANLLDAQTGDVISVLADPATTEYGSDFQDASFNSRGDRVLTQSPWGGRVRLWDARNGKLIHECCDEGGSWSGAFASDGATLVVYSLSSAAAWLVDTLDGQRVGEISGDSAIHSVAFSAATTSLYAGFADGRVRIWPSGIAGRVVDIETRDGRPVTTLASSNDGSMLLSGHFRGVARIWNADGALLLTLQHSVPAISGGPEDCSHTTNDESVCDWYQVAHASFSPDGSRLLTLAWDGPDEGFADFTASLWDTRTGRLLASLPDDDEPTVAAQDASFSATGSMTLVTGSDGLVRIWNAHDGTVRDTLSRHADVVHEALFTRDETMVVTLAQGDDPRVWNISPAAPNDSALPAGWSSPPAAPEAASALMERARHELHFPERRFGNCMLNKQVVAPDLRWVVTLFHSCETDTTTAMQLWSAKDESVAYLRAAGEWVLDAAFSPGSRRIATIDTGGVVRLWDTRTAEFVAALTPAVAGKSSALAFSKDGNRLAVRGQDGTVTAWPMLPHGQALIDYAHWLVPQPLIEIERRRE